MPGSVAVCPKCLQPWPLHLCLSWSRGYHIYRRNLLRKKTKVIFLLSSPKAGKELPSRKVWQRSSALMLALTSEMCFYLSQSQWQLEAGGRQQAVLSVEWQSEPLLGTSSRISTTTTLGSLGVERRRLGSEENQDVREQEWPPCLVLAMCLQCLASHRTLRQTDQAQIPWAVYVEAVPLMYYFFQLTNLSFCCCCCCFPDLELIRDNGSP